MRGGYLDLVLRNVKRELKVPRIQEIWDSKSGSKDADFILFLKQQSQAERQGRNWHKED